MHCKRMAQNAIWSQERKLKVFHFAKLNNDLGAVDTSNELLKEMNIDGLTCIDDPLMKAHHAVCSAALKVLKGPTNLLAFQE